MDKKHLTDKRKTSPLSPFEVIDNDAPAGDSPQSERLRASLARIEAAEEERRKEGRRSALAEAAARRRAQGDDLDDTRALDGDWLKALKRPWRQDKPTPYAVEAEEKEAVQAAASAEADEVAAEAPLPFAETPADHTDEVGPGAEDLLAETPAAPAAAPEAEDMEEAEEAEEAAFAEDLQEDLPDALASMPTTGQLYEGLLALAEDLRTGKSPLFRENQVILDRERHLALLDHLLGLCADERIYGISPEDALVDVLASDGHDSMADAPMRRVKERARVILGDATVQAETILGDARALASQLLSEAEEKISKRYEEAEADLDQLIANNKEASRNHLMDARAELSASRKQAVDILNKYMEKAEEDYQGYWERAEKTLLVSYEKSDRALEKGAEIFEKELALVKMDMETLEEIITDLKNKRPR